MRYTVIVGPEGEQTSGYYYGDSEPVVGQEIEIEATDENGILFDFTGKLIEVCEWEELGE